jgi:hypothetical protein
MNLNSSCVIFTAILGDDDTLIPKLTIGSERKDTHTSIHIVNTFNPFATFVAVQNSDPLMNDKAHT